MSGLPSREQLDVRADDDTAIELLDTGGAGITFTENDAMWPAAAVSGFHFAHPAAQYFAVGKIDRDQTEDYARRKQSDVAKTERWLAPALAYDT